MSGVGGLRLLLDTTILSAACHPRDPDYRPVNAWLETLLESGNVEIYLPEISDYEVRRGLLHIALRSRVSTTRSLRRLDELGALLEYLPLDTATMRQAAQLWAEARHDGLPTAPDHGLDGDVILAAQARGVGGVVVTDNISHLSRYVDARRWEEVSSGRAP